MKQFKTILAVTIILVAASGCVVNHNTLESKYSRPANSAGESDNEVFVDFSNMEYYKQ